MLVISRNVDEKILIGDDIVITLVRIKGPYSIRIGIDAPRDLAIRRLTPNGEFEGNQGDWQRDKSPAGRPS